MPVLAPWIQRLLQQDREPVQVQLSADFGVDLPVEVFGEHGPGYVTAQALGLSAELEADLLAWQRWYEAHVDTSQEPMELGGQREWANWKDEAGGLVQRLRDELGEGFEVRSA